MGVATVPLMSQRAGFFCAPQAVFWAGTRNIQPKKQGKYRISHAQAFTPKEESRSDRRLFSSLVPSSFSPQAALLGWRSSPQHDVHSASRGLDPRCTCGCCTLGGYELARAHADKRGFLRCRRRRWSTFALTQYVFRARAHSKPTGAG